MNTTLLQRKEDGTYEFIVEPLDIRDTFAIGVIPKFIEQYPDHKIAAQRAYQVADIMLEVREEQRKKSNG